MDSLRRLEAQKYPDYVVDIGYKDIKLGDNCPRGAQLRPDIVWFGEAVPAMDEAIEITARADIFVVVGTSLNVYPAAGLLDYVTPKTPIYLVDPNKVSTVIRRDFTFIQEKAGAGVDILIQKLIG